MFTRIQKKGDVIKTTYGFAPSRRGVLKGMAAGSAAGAVALGGLPAHAETNLAYPVNAHDRYM